MDFRFGGDDVRILADEEIWHGYFTMRAVTVQHRLFAGGWSQALRREVFERGSSVGVLLYDPERDELVMLEQFRAGSLADPETPWMLELVAGIVEPDESDEDVARREALEEAAIEVRDMEPIASFYPSAGACTEHVRLFVGRVSAQGAGGIHGCVDEGEDIRVHVMARETVLDYLARGRIVNGHTLIALQWLQIHGEALRRRWL